MSEQTISVLVNATWSQSSNRRNILEIAAKDYAWTALMLRESSTNIYSVAPN